MDDKGLLVEDALFKDPALADSAFPDLMAAVGGACALRVCVLTPQLPCLQLTCRTVCCSAVAPVPLRACHPALLSRWLP
jgi:hypothetical protein